jgi:hypothetical protein
MQKETKTLIEIVEQVKAEMCDRFCKWPDQYKCDESAYDRMIDEKCEHCPLNRL